MKRIVCLFLLLSLCLLCGCNPAGSEGNVTTIADGSDTTSEDTTSDPKEELLDYLDNISNYYQHVQQAGEPTSYIYMDEALVIGIIYPVTSVDALDSEIESWVNDVAEQHINKMADANVSDAAELHITYDSYKAGESVISVKLSGSFTSQTLAHPVDIVKVFNFDTEKGELIEADSIISTECHDSFVKTVASSAGIPEESIDGNFLKNAILTDTGIEITFNRGEYLAMYEGTKVVFFEYSEISDYMKDTMASVDEEPEEEIPQKPEEDTPVVQEPSKLDPTKPMIALTFDDGPSAHTDRLLDIFKENGGKGTFFVVGYLIDYRPQTLQRIAEEGHEIGNHSWDHKQLTTLTEEELRDQLMMTRAKIYDVTGVDCTVMRPPYGSCNDFVKSVGAELGISFVNWSVDTLDWKTKNAQAVYDEIIKSAKNGSIVLCHDLHASTVDAMELVIPRLIAEGYQLVTVSELLSVTNEELVPGKMYYKQ